VKKTINFEELGGIGDGDASTGSGTDNAKAFELCLAHGEDGYQVIFPAGKVFKTTKPIPIHDMDWIGDMNNPPTIFGWFSSAGNPIIGRNKTSAKKCASIRGIRFHRCGPHPEHGIIVDNMRSFNFDGWVSAIVANDGHVLGGAIGVSPFQPAHRPSSNVSVKARISNSANFGVQFGNVSDGSIQVFAQNCMREVIGIEPYCRGFVDFKARDVYDDIIHATDHGLSNAQPLIYAAIGEGGTVEGFPRSNYWFAIVVDKNSIRIAASEQDAAAGNNVKLGAVPDGIHRLYICGVAERIRILPSRINNLNPPTQRVTRSLDGVVVLTATSAGYAKDIDTGSVVVSDIGNRAAGYCVTLLGLWGITISGFDLRGGRIGGIRVGRGTLGGLRDDDGVPINPPRVTRILPQDILVKNNTVRDFARYGVNVLDGGAKVIANVVSSQAKNARGISTTGHASASASASASARTMSTSLIEDNKVAVPRGTRYGRSDPDQRD